MAVKKSKSESGAGLSKEAAKIVSRLDEIQAGREEEQELLGKLINTLGASSFDHPSRGPMTIMTRGEVYFWRARPNGRPVAMKKAKSGGKATKKVKKSKKAA